MDSWQARADQATTALGVRAVTVVVQPGNRGHFQCATMRLDLGTDSGDTEWLLAHELGHHLSVTETLIGCGGTLQHEEEANAQAVRVLQVWGYTQAEAVAATLRHLRRRAREGNPVPGHDYGREIADIQKRFPN